MANITITLEDPILERLREQSEQQGGRSISSIIREALGEKFEKERPTTLPAHEEVTR